MPSTISAGTTAGTAIAIAGDTTGNLAFQTNGTTTAMTIDTSQNVGIGTTSPNGRVTIGNNATDTALSGTTNTQGLHLYARNFGISQIDSLVSGSSNSGMSLRTYNNGTYTEFIANDQGNTTRFQTAGTERMRITSAGQVNLTRPTGDDTQINFLYMQGGGASAGDNLAFLSKYTTTVSTSAKAIFGGPPRGSIVVVTGYTGSSYFSDILNCSSNSVTVISSQNSTGSPASRTYSIVSFVLNLQMGSGTYNVGTLLLGTAPRE